MSTALPKLNTLAMQSLLQYITRKIVSPSYVIYSLDAAFTEASTNRINRPETKIPKGPIYSLRVAEVEGEAEANNLQIQLLHDQSVSIVERTSITSQSALGSKRLTYLSCSSSLFVNPLISPVIKSLSTKL